MEITKPDWKSFSLRRKLKVDEWLASKGITSYKKLKEWCEEQGMVPPAPGEVKFPKKETKTSETKKTTKRKTSKKTKEQETTTKEHVVAGPVVDEKEEEKPLDEDLS